MESYIHLYEKNSEFTAAYNGSDYKEPWLSLTEEGMKVNYNKPKLTAIAFDNITWVTDVPATGGTATKDNCTFKVYGKYDNGISVDISSDAVVTGELAVPSSTEGQRHEAGTLTLNASYGGFSATGNVTAYQAAPDFSMSPLTFKISSPGTINWTATDSSASKTIEYNLNNGDKWVSITSNMEGVKIEVNPGDKIQFKGNNATYCGDNPESPYNTFGGSTARFEVEGNIMSLINSTNFITATTLDSNFTFSWLFRGCTGLTSAENLILPATTLAMGCYFSMFNGCTSLTTAPKLPATTLVMGCYIGMFQDCASLTSAPALPATTLATSCYNSMFTNCSSLTTAPELLATTLAMGCYSGMFNGCTSLTTAPALPATTLATSCYERMFQDCTSLATVPSNLLPATTLANSCYEYMFEGCTSLTTAPELPANILVDGCYRHMFYDCTKLNYIKCLAKNIPVDSCTVYWVDGVAATGTFVKYHSMNAWTTGSDGIPYGWTVTDNKEPLTFKISSHGTINWKASDSSASKTIEYKLNDGNWASITSNTGASAPTITVKAGDKIQFRGNNATYGGYSNRDDYSSFSGSTARFEIEGSIMSLINSTRFVTATTLDSAYTFSYLFNGCTGLTSAKNLILPVTTLTNYCYSHMFYGCTSLTTAPELPATTLTNYCYSHMFYGCTSLNYIKCLATDISATDCTSNWANGVAATGTFVKNSNMTSWATSSSGIPEGWTVEEYIDYNKEPLTFKITSGGTVNWAAIEVSPKTIDYKLNDGNWTSITPNMEGVKINVNAGDKIQFRGDNTVYGAYKGYNTFSGSTARFEAEGNIMSLINSTDFVTATTLNNYYTFSRLFSDCTGLTSAENLILPATILMESCYEYMFSYCTSLKTAPALPAITLATSCYEYMFQNCISLTTAPELPATTLANSCYENMFQNCSSLTTAPSLPATTLANNCYSGMFYGCTSLTTAPKLPAMTLATSCYENMFSNCTSLTLASELPATRLEDYCYLNMFLGCTSLTKAPELPATTLKRMCYQSMFNGCTSLNYIKCLATDISAYNCTYYWVNGVASAGTFVQAGATGWTRGNDGIPNNWTVEKEIVS